MRRIKIMLERAIKLRKYMRKRQNDAVEHMNKNFPYLLEMDRKQYDKELVKFYESYPKFEDE